MALTPIMATPVTIGQAVEVESTADQTSRTYAVNWQTGRISGFVDGKEAVKQAIYKIMQTERFAHIIYSWNYGIELDRVIGANESTLRAELYNIIFEALTADERITGVEDFTIERTSKRAVEVHFTAVTVFGDIEIAGEVTA